MIPDSVELLLEQISSDHLSGASTLAKRAAKCMVVFAEESRIEDPTDFWRELYGLGKKLVRTQPDMAPIFNLVDQTLGRTKNTLEEAGTMQALQNAVCEACQQYIEGSKSAFERLGELGLSLIEDGDTILTHSYSASVCAVLELAHQERKALSIICTESRPSMEGKALAKHLGDMGMMVTLIVDAAALHFLPRCDKIFVGCDCLTEEHFLNKVGSFSIALGAHHLGKPCYLVTESGKFLPGHEPLPIHDNHHPADEVVEKPPENIHIENPYFERVGLQFTSQVITEKGIMPSQEVGRELNQEVRFPDLLL